MLDAAYITECEQRARRFQGCWDTGTSGTLAADSMRLLKERQELLATIDTLTSANQALRDAVATRLAGCQPAQKAALRTFDTTTDDARPQGDEPPEELSIPHDWILRGQRELEAHKDDIRCKADGVMYDGTLRPGSREFLAVLDELRSLHLAKTLDYGIDDDALSNIRTSADIVNMPAWAGCVLRISDKMHRLKAFFRRGRVEFDGIEDTLKDISCYAAIALVLYREGRATTPA